MDPVISPQSLAACRFGRQSAVAYNIRGCHVVCVLSFLCLPFYWRINVYIGRTSAFDAESFSGH